MQRDPAIMIPPIWLPDLVVTPTREQIFMFSAITWNRHKIHYSDSYAQSEGHRDIVVQRGLLGNFLARQIGNWLPSHGSIRRLSWRVIESAYPDEPIICKTELTGTLRSEHSIYLKFASRIIGTNSRLIVKGEAEAELINTISNESACKQLGQTLESTLDATKITSSRQKAKL